MYLLDMNMVLIIHAMNNALLEVIIVSLDSDSRFTGRGRCIDVARRDVELVSSIHFTEASDV